MATIQDVARRAGVSTATVSRVLSAPDIVSDKTKRKVMRAVDALAYAPNHAAKSLRTLKSGKIVVTVPDIANPFFSTVIQGVEEAAQAAGYSVLLGDIRHDSDRLEQYASMLLRKEADGLIFLGHRLPSVAKQLIAKKGRLVPVVNGCEFSPALGVPSAHIDNAAATAEVMQLLYSLGHRRIGIITGPLESPLSRDRLKGAKRRTAEWGNASNLSIAVGDFSVEAGARETEIFLRSAQPPSAIFCFSDEMAIGALAAIRRLGLECPKDISVVGFDDIRFAQYMYPSLTTVRQPSHEIGSSTVKLLVSILSGEMTKPESITLPHQIITRDSTAPWRG